MKMMSDLYAPDGYPLEYMNGADEDHVEHVSGYTPHDKQWELHESTARFRIANAGRRFGKTLACSNEIIKFALEHQGSLCWWVAPFYRTSRIAYRLVGKAIEPYTKRNYKSDMRIEVDNGSIIEFLSAENYDSLRGEGVHFMILDECALIQKDAWEQALRPTLTDHEGSAIFISTPKGRNWFYQLYQRGLDANEKNYESFAFPTSSNPFISESELEDVRKTLPEDVFRQEYLAEFLEDSAGVFRGISHCIQGQMEEPKPEGRYVAGWDLARTNDYSVVTVIDVDTKHVVYFDRFNQIDWKSQINRVEEIVKRYNNAKLWMDSTGVGDAVFDNVWERGIDVEGYKFTLTSKRQLIHNLQLLISEQGISFPDIPELVRELEIYEYKISNSGNMTYSAPSGSHDDAVMSLCLSAWGMKEWVPEQVFI